MKKEDIFTDELITKWKETYNSYQRKKIPDIPIKYKTLFEEESPAHYWTMAGDEYFEYLNMVSIEWFKILLVK